ncbi:MAG: DUF3302 domain-containing protein [Hyphomicrobiales bacterium]
MTGLDIFALIILIILFAAIIGIWLALAMAPGKIARARNHPQADAINVCGWWGAITLGLLTPLAFIWAYTARGPLFSSSQEEANAESAKGAGS